MPNAISQHYTDEMLGHPLTTHEKILLFADRVNGWQLDVAERLLRADGHAGFAALSIVLSYFEMIATYESGEAFEGEAGADFERGVRSVLEFHRSASPQEIPDGVFQSMIDVLRLEGRNGMYHNASTGPRVLLRIADDMPLVGFQDGRLQLDPKKFVDAV